MYSISSLKKAVTQPRKAIAEVNRLWERGFDIRSSPAHNDRGVDVISADWDNLIILDACRYDTFRELASDLPGELTKVESRASATNQFLRANFSGKELYDTVYVTANPQLYRIENGIYDIEPINVSFHEQRDVWRDQWHEEHRTVMPEVVTEAALEAAAEYPNKRLIVHYLQPHAPYIGETGIEELPTEYLNFWSSFENGEFEVSLETARRAYRENLELVLPHVVDLLAEFEGKTVVTADHGELLGERDFPVPIRRFGHPSYTNMSALLEVPWLVHESGTRPDIVSERPEEIETGETLDSDVVKKRLQDLGYAE
jgi:hypothetical protein